MKYPKIPKEGIFVTNHGNVSWEEFILIYAFAPKDNELRKELVEAIEYRKKYEKKHSYKW